MVYETYYCDPISGNLNAETHESVTSCNRNIGTGVSLFHVGRHKEPFSVMKGSKPHAVEKKRTSCFCICHPTVAFFTGENRMVYGKC